RGCRPTAEHSSKPCSLDRRSSRSGTENRNAESGCYAIAGLRHGGLSLHIARPRGRTMKQIMPTLGRRSALAIVAVASSLVLGQNKADTGMTTDIPGAQPNIHVVAPVADGQWTMPAGDYGNTRYSPLDQINTTNVHNLHVVGEVSTGILHGHEGSPLVVGD